MPRSRATTAAALESLRRETDQSGIAKSIAIADRLLAELEQPQRDVLLDDWPRKAVRTPRQVGKTTTGVAYLLDPCLRIPDAVVVGIELTLKTAKSLLWKPLKKLQRKLGFEAQFHNTDLIATFPATNATLIIGGAETEADIEKYRGLTLNRALVDEAKSFPSRLLDGLLAEVLEPALLHRKGTLLMMGTPGNVLAGTFFETTGPNATRIIDIAGERWAKSRPYRERRSAKWRGVKFEYSFHTWKFSDLKGKWARAAEVEALAVIKRAGYSLDNPIRKREWDGEWTPDDAKAVYRFDSTRDTWEAPEGVSPVDALPKGHDWRFLIGVDLGYSDPFAIQIAAAAETHPNLYQVYEWEAKQLTVPAMAAALRDAIEAVGGEDLVDAIVGDFGALGDSILQTLLEEYGIAVEKASKKEKRDHIELLNSDLVEERCKVLKNSRLAAEMAHLQWDEKRPDKEKSGLANHNADAFVYLWRKARHHEGKEPTVTPPPDSREARDARVRDEMQRHAKKKRVAEPEDDDEAGGFGITNWASEEIDEW